MRAVFHCIVLLSLQFSHNSYLASPYPLHSHTLVLLEVYITKRNDNTKTLLAKSSIFFPQNRTVLANNSNTKVCE